MDRREFYLTRIKSSIDSMKDIIGKDSCCKYMSKIEEASLEELSEIVDMSLQIELANYIRGINSELENEGLVDEYGIGTRNGDEDNGVSDIKYIRDLVEKAGNDKYDNVGNVWVIQKNEHCRGEGTTEHEVNKIDDNAMMIEFEEDDEEVDRELDSELYANEYGYGSSENSRAEIIFEDDEDDSYDELAFEEDDEDDSELAFDEDDSDLAFDEDDSELAFDEDDSELAFDEDDEDDSELAFEEDDEDDSELTFEEDDEDDSELAFEEDDEDDSELAFEEDDEDDSELAFEEDDEDDSELAFEEDDEDDSELTFEEDDEDDSELTFEEDDEDDSELAFEEDDEDDSELTFEEDSYNGLTFQDDDEEDSYNGLTFEDDGDEDDRYTIQRTKEEKNTTQYDDSDNWDTGEIIEYGNDRIQLYDTNERHGKNAQEAVDILGGLADIILGKKKKRN